MVLHFVGEYVAAFLFKTRFIYESGFLFLKITQIKCFLNLKRQYNKLASSVLAVLFFGTFDPI